MTPDTPGPGDRCATALCRDCGRRPDAQALACETCGSERIVRHRELHALAIAHLDCDAFYAAIEKRDRPELREVPVIVGRHHRGVVAACCYLARTYGVHSAMPMFKALKACPDAVVVKPDMQKYEAAGREVRSMMLRLTPLVEPLSIDEAFMDFTGTDTGHRASPARMLAGLARKVEARLSITISIGLSYNKFLAKIASDLDKPRGYAVIGRAEAREFLAGRPVGLLWGVGQALQYRLARDGITQIGQIAGISEKEMVSRYGKIGRQLWSFARGEDERPVNPVREVKSISSETTLAEDLSDPARLRPILRQLSGKVAQRMKKAGVIGRGVTLKLKTSDFRLLTRSRRLEHATCSPEAIYRAGDRLLCGEADGRAFRLIGIGAHSLTSADTLHQGEGDLFGADPAGGPGDAPVEEMLDEIREKFGPRSVVRGRDSGNEMRAKEPGKAE